jgi:hypothetical protein
VNFYKKEEKEENQLQEKCRTETPKAMDIESLIGTSG